jgi:formate hydrogenlyase transcriptional activator
MSTSPGLVLDKTSERYEALLRATAALASCRDCESFERRFASDLRSVIDFDYLNFVIFDEGNSTAKWRLFESTVKSAAISEAQLSTNETTSGWVYQHQQRLVIEDWDQESRFSRLKRILSELNIGSTCALPLTTAHRRFGVIEFGSSRPNAYPEAEAGFLSLVADHVALTIEGALNFEEAQRAQAELQSNNERLKLLLDMTNTLVSNLELRDLLRAISASIRQVMHCDVVGVWLPDGEQHRLRQLAMDFPESKGFAEEDSVYPVEGSLVGRVFRTGKSVVIGTKTDVLNERETSEVRAEGIESGLVLPLISRNRTVGVLTLGSRVESSFSPEDIDFLLRAAGQVAIAVENAVAYSEIADLKDRLAQEKLYLEDEIRGQMDFEGIVGQGTALRHVLQLVETVAPSDSTVLLLGETGTGKELIARAIHERSRRKDRTLVKLNCAAIPTGLLESELFGHEKGAFTGAVSQKVGRLELADKGTLFLDEVGDIPPELQPKLLRALQEREFERLGSSRTVKVDTRLVAATNRDLEKMVGNHEFRSDLYYRLNVFPIRIPPLRERPEDIPLLVRYFAQKYAQRMEKQIESIPAAAIKRLTRWHWPGNIRELENFIERAVILTRGATLEVPPMELKSDVTAVVPVAGTREWNDREEIMRILKEARGRVGGADGAAARMGIKRTTLISRIKKLGIDPRAVVS